jgi:hypothetical protein
VVRLRVRSSTSAQGAGADADGPVAGDDDALERAHRSASEPPHVDHLDLLEAGLRLVVWQAVAGENALGGRLEDRVAGLLPVLLGLPQVDVAQAAQQLTAALL